MQKSTSWLKRTFLRMFPFQRGKEGEDLRMMRPFLWLVVVGLTFLYGFSIYYHPELRAPGRLVPFTLLMALHGLLHWNVFYYGLRRVSGTIYFVVQALLAFIITLLGNNVSLAYGLFMSLIGEALGFIGINIYGASAVAVLLAFSGVSVYWIAGASQLQNWALTAVGMTLFISIFVVMISRLAAANERSQALLKDLETAHSQLAEYADQVEDLTLAAERQRMARELHDTLSQGLAGVILQLEAVDAHLADRRTEKAQAVLQQAMERARATLADARRAIGDLRAAQLRGSFEEALRSEVERFQRATGLNCRLELSLADELPEKLAEQALRMAAEGLSNIARHARASQAWVRAAQSGQQLEIEIGDDGVGFDPQQAASQPDHYGLLGLSERARLNGGSLDIRSSPGEGTHVRVRFPLPPAESEAQGE